jgi:hypothetical protein
MRILIAGILVVAFGSSGCNRQPLADNAGAAAAPVAAGTAVPRNADEAAPVAAPAAAMGLAPEAARPPAPADAATTGVGGAMSAAIPRDDWREITIPAGTSLPIVLDTAIASDTSALEGPVTAHLSRAIRVGGLVALPQGSVVSGVVTDATRAAKVKGRAHIAVKFDTVTAQGGDERYHLQAGQIARTAAATKQNDAVKILGPAAAGAIIGRIAGGKKGAAIGAGAGAGAGTAVVMNTRGKEVRLGRGAALTLRLTEPLTVRVKN